MRIKKLPKISLSPQQTAGYSREIFRFANDNFCLQGKIDIFSGPFKIIDFEGLKSAAASCWALNPNFKIQGKRGWLHVIEAFLAVLILIGILFFQIKDISSSPTENILTIERALIKEVARNNTLKEELLSYPLPTALDSGSPSEIARYVSSRVPSGVDFKIMVCTIDDPCIASQKGAIVQDVFIASTANIYSPRKFKIFMWTVS